MLDGGEAESAFGTVFEQWIRSRLAGPTRPDDPIVALLFSRDFTPLLSFSSRHSHADAVQKVWVNRVIT